MTKRPKETIACSSEHRVHRGNLRDCMCGPRWPRACVLAYAPPGRRKAAQETAALQLEIRLLRLGEWHVQRTHYPSYGPMSGKREAVP